MAKYVFSWSCIVCKSALARGVDVAKVSMANCSGLELDLEKSMLLNVAFPEVTSGTVAMVVLVVEQVTLSTMAVTESCTSAGRAVLPTTKQALAWRDSRGAVGHSLLVILWQGKARVVWSGWPGDQSEATTHRRGSERSWSVPGRRRRRNA